VPHSLKFVRSNFEDIEDAVNEAFFSFAASFFEIPTKFRKGFFTFRIWKVFGKLTESTKKTL
jgi:hypothetical protein